MAQDEVDRQFNLGMIGPLEYKRLKSRAALRAKFLAEDSSGDNGNARPGAVSANAIDDRAQQGRSPPSWGPDGHAGNIDSRTNKRADREADIRGRPDPRAGKSTNAQVQDISHFKYSPNWYGENT